METEDGTALPYSSEAESFLKPGANGVLLQPQQPSFLGLPRHTPRAGDKDAQETTPGFSCWAEI